MIRHRSHIAHLARHTLLLLAMAGTAAVASAQQVEYIPVDDADSAVVAELSDTFTRYAYSVDRWLKVESPREPHLTQRNVFSSFESGFKRATVARLEYTFPVEGGTATRVYHAMSGVEPDEAFARLLSTKDGVSPKPLSPVADQFRNTRWDVRANGVGESESELHAAETADGLDHSADAELKAFRALERDLKEGKVAAGGQLRVRVSKIPCESCRKVFAKFADHFGMSAEIAYTEEGSEAYGAFDERRKAVFRTVRNNRAGARPLRPLEGNVPPERLPLCE